MSTIARRGYTMSNLFFQFKESISSLRRDAFFTEAHIIELESETYIFDIANT